MHRLVPDLNPDIHIWIVRRFKIQKFSPFLRCKNSVLLLQDEPKFFHCIIFLHYLL